MLSRYDPMSKLFRDPTLLAPGRELAMPDELAAAQHQAATSEASRGDATEAGGSLGNLLTKLISGGTAGIGDSGPELFGIPIRDLVGGAAAGVAGAYDTSDPMQALARGYLGADTRRTKRAAARTEAERTGFDDRLKLADFLLDRENVESQIGRREHLNKNPGSYASDPDERAREIRSWAKDFLDSGEAESLDQAYEMARERVDDIYGGSGSGEKASVKGEGTRESPFMPEDAERAAELPPGAYFIDPRTGDLRQIN